MTAARYVLTHPEGEIAVSPAALTQIVVAAAEAGDGARVRRPRRGLAVSIEDGRARVACELVAPYGAMLPQLARGVQQRVGEALEAMCGLDVEAVDVAIEELDEG